VSRLLTPKEIAERALRKIGAYSINDTGADAEETSEALFWLDMIVASFVAKTRAQWLVQRDITRALTASTASYLLETLLAADMPADKVYYIIGARLRYSNGDEEELEIVRRAKYDEIAQKTSSGTPAMVYIDRITADQKLFLHPVPGVSGFSIVLTLVANAPNMTASAGGSPHSLRVGWQLWLAKALAAEIGDGPVRRLRRADVDAMRRDAAIERAELIPADQEYAGDGRTAGWGA